MNEPETAKIIESQEMVLPVLREELEISKQKVQTGSVRIRKTVREREEVVDEPLLADTVQIERVPINQVVDSVIPIRLEGETTVISVVEEMLVVTKQLVLKEEIRISNRRSEIREPQRVTLRSEEISIDRGSVQDGVSANPNMPSISTASEGDFGAFQEGTIEVIETAEEGIISKVARVVEEVVVSKNVTERQQIVHDTIRHTEVHTEQLSPDQVEKLDSDR